MSTGHTAPGPPTCPNTHIEGVNSYRKQEASPSSPLDGLWPYTTRRLLLDYWLAASAKPQGGRTSLGDLEEWDQLLPPYPSVHLDVGLIRAGPSEQELNLTEEELTTGGRREEQNVY